MNDVDVRHWSTEPIQVHNIQLSFDLHFQKLLLVSQKRVSVSLEGCLQHTESASPIRFPVFLELLHPENEMDNVRQSFDIQVQNLNTSKGDPKYKVSCSPEMSTLIANTVHFKWERFMVNHSLYFRVTASSQPKSVV